MNRRSFFTKLGLAAASVAILPAATTYARTWVKKEIWIPNPEWLNANYEIITHWNFGTMLREKDFIIPNNLQAAYFQRDCDRGRRFVLDGFNGKSGICREVFEFTKA